MHNIWAFDIVFAYLIGSISSAIIVSKLFDLPDPRQHGSKNPGATNILRLSGKKFAIIVGIFDALKGLFPVVIAKILGAPPSIVAYTCLAAVFGHMYPIYFGFHGGKGVATALGALLGMHFLFGTSVIVTWLLVANLFGYSSLASLLSMIIMPLFSLFFLSRIDTFIPLLAITILVLFKHKDNITRLIDGTESKINLNLFKNANDKKEEVTPAENNDLEEDEREILDSTTKSQKDKEGE